MNRKGNSDPMEAASRTGSRIRARRLDLGLKQVDLARDCGISAAYLNLIEHNRRAIGGALLNRIARALRADPTRLAEGAETALTLALDAATAGAAPGTGAENENAEEVAQRYPGFARLIEVLHRDNQRLERQVEMLGDRLTHDPHLSASLHTVLSAVTSIRSTSGILAGDETLEPDWQARFHRNLHEESRRLADAADGLVRYLDGAADADARGSLPQEEVEAWFEAEGWCVEALEDDPGADIDALLASAGLGRGAEIMARAVLRRYAADVRALPRDALREAADAAQGDPLAVAARTGAPLPLVLRRMAAVAPVAPAPGLVICDASGTLTFRRPVDGFPLPRFGAACPLWPLFETLRQPQAPVRHVVEMPGQRPLRFECCAISEVLWPDGYEGAGVVEAVMLIRPFDVSEGAARAIGPSCRICPRERCAARREPSIIGSPVE